MSRHFYKVAVVVSLAAILVVYNNCGSPFGMPTPLYFESNVYGGSSEISYDAFESTVYPITRNNCVSCHSTQQPAHASDDVKEAHDSLIQGFKVNFTNVSQSRMVKKLRDENHNCWGDCEENAIEMEEAILEWNDLIKDSGVDPTPESNIVDTKKYTDESKFLSEEMTINGNVVRQNVTILNLETAMFNPPMTRVNSAADGIYIHVPNLVNNTLANNDPAAGTASFNFMVRQNSNQYRIWGLVNAPSTSDNGFYTNITTTNTGVKEWEIPVTTGWEWRQLLNNNFTLNNGAPHTLQLRQRKDGTKIKKVVITSDNNFNGTTANDFMGVTLTYDLSTILRVPGITFKVDVMDYDLYSYKFQNPRIVTSSVNVKVKNVKLLVNKAYNPQHSTFTLIDKTATPADGRLSDFAMVVIKENGFEGDKISFAFDEIQLENGGNGQDDPALVASQEAFRTSVWAVSRTSCINCHTAQNPPHAHDDYKEAHDVVLTQNLVNFTTPGSSRLVTKTRGRHNCGTQTQCDAIATQFQNAIMQWRNSRP